MNAELRSVKTGAEQALAEAYAAAKAKLPGDRKVGALRDAAVARFGGIDVLVNNAGISGRYLPIEEIDEETFKRMFAVTVNDGLAMRPES